MTDHEQGKMDIKAQEKTFDGFMKIVTWVVVVVFVLLVGMAVFIS